jgi:hypothetical protein
MNIRRTLLLATVLTASVAAGNQASAQCAAMGGGYGGYGFGAWDIGRLYSVLADNVPYHAAFPPVYYSYPVPRTYGYSPFAYPPGVMTPEVEMGEPQVIENPYYKGDAEEAAPEEVPAPADETTSNAQPTRPLVIVNPYVTDAKLAASR